MAVQAGYAIALPDSGQLIYEDHTSDDTGQAPLKPLLQVGSVDLGQFMEIKSIWYVSVTKAK